jgi:hypothetical protein
MPGATLGLVWMGAPRMVGGTWYWGDGGEATWVTMEHVGRAMG